MQQIEPYISASDTLLSLDNGGRFYNMMTHVADGVVTPAELGKVAGLFNDRQKMILFLQLSMTALSEPTKAEIISKMDEKLQQSYQKYKALELLPSEAQDKGIIAANAIITGVPKVRESKSDLNGFVMVPISTGKGMTLMMIPIIDEYDVYEIRDEASSETFLVAHARSKEKLPEQKIKVAGVIKELELKKGDKNSPAKFLEVNYFLSAN